jgi:alcohol dehydrogenase
MKAATYTTFAGPVVVSNVADPKPPPGGVVLEVRANGVCRSDWHAWLGHDPSVQLPHVPGHEMAGVVAATGEGVAEFRVGDRVTAPFVLGCGLCEQCASGNEQVCDNQYQAGFSGWGSFAEYVALPYADNNLVLLPESMDFGTAAGLGCRFATSFRAVVDQGEVSESDAVAVWGCGGVGLSAVMIASALGAEVFAVDVNPSALALASSFGATHIFDASDGSDVARTIKDATSGGVQVSIDALGSTSTSLSSVRSVAKRGRHVQVGLMLGDDAAPGIPMWRLHQNEIELFGSHGMQAWRYPAMLEMVAAGRLQPEKLITRQLSLTEGAEHLMAMGDFPGTGFCIIDDFTA